MPATVTEQSTRSRMLGLWNSAVTSYYLIIGATAMLVGLGLIMVLSSSSVRSLQSTDGSNPYEIFSNQALYATVGIAVAVLASRLPVRVFRALAWPALLVALGLQALVFTSMGQTWGGNRNWISFAGISLQPAEVIKLALAIWLGSVLARKRHLLNSWLHVFFPAVAVSLLALGLVLLGHDLGTALVLMFLIAGALFVAGIPMRMFVLAGVIATIGIINLAQSSESRMRRILAFFSADCDPLGACYQTSHGLSALASGNVFGIGIGESREKWLYLPAAHNDFIYAIIGEELGLIGTLLVLVLFALIALACARIVRRSTDPFVQITTGAVAAWVLGQAAVNIAVVVGLIPVIGVPLPLVSAGGSALIVTLGAMGMLAAFARNEPGAASALNARGKVVRQSVAVVATRRGR